MKHLHAIGNPEIDAFTILPLPVILLEPTTSVRVSNDD